MREPRCPELESKAGLKQKFRSRILFIDTTLKEGGERAAQLNINPLDWEAQELADFQISLSVYAHECLPCVTLQASVAAYRQACMEHDIPLRPRIFMEEKKNEIVQVGEEASSSSPSAQRSPSAASMTPTETLFLHCKGSFQGVLQVHKVGFLSMLLLNMLSSHNGVPLIPFFRSGAVDRSGRVCLSLANRGVVESHA